MYKASPKCRFFFPSLKHFNHAFDNVRVRRSYVVVYLGMHKIPSSYLAYLDSKVRRECSHMEFGSCSLLLRYGIFRIHLARYINKTRFSSRIILILFAVPTLCSSSACLTV